MQRQRDNEATDLHNDLVRKYKRHGAVIDKIWRGFGAGQRAKCVKAGVMEGVLLRHSGDTTLGDNYKIFPEWNLRDLTERPEHFLSMLEHRIEKTPMEQYCYGVNGSKGDADIIQESMRTQGLRPPASEKDWYMLFSDGEWYGFSVYLPEKDEKSLGGFVPAIRAGLVPPSDIGQLILKRQVTLLRSLNILIDDILDQGSKTRSTDQRPKKPGEITTAAFSKLSISQPPAKLSLADLVNAACDQAAFFKERIELCSEPAVLAHDVSFWFCSRPEILPDEKGRRLPVVSDKRLDAKRPSTSLHAPALPPHTTAAKAVEWLKKLGDLHQAYPEEREKLVESEFESLCDLATTVAFIQDVTKLIELKTGIDLRDFAVPIDNLLEPGMTAEALENLNQFMVDNAGAKLGVLYEDLVFECFSDLENQYQQYKIKITQGQKDWTPLPVPAPEPRETLVEQRKQKEKTRPAHVSAFEVGPEANVSTTEPVVEKQTFKVSPAAADVFNALFKKSESRGAVNWTVFEGAMAELGFSVLPKYGSVFTFMPPDSMAVKRPFTIHRPHKSQTEGYMTLVYSRRLARAYGWDEKTFSVA
ncbi:Ipa protein [Colletotrichum scovillei]|nr:Ipa protein [Colletotrichum scovillei]